MELKGLIIENELHAYRRAEREEWFGCNKSKYGTKSKDKNQDEDKENARRCRVPGQGSQDHREISGKEVHGARFPWVICAIWPKSQFGIDIENDFAPKYINIRGKGDLIKALKKDAKHADKIYLASDPDREGEAIALASGVHPRT